MTNQRGARPLSRRILNGVALSLGLAAALGACSRSDTDQAQTGVYRLFNSQRNPALETLENTVQYSIVAPSQAMVSAPTALMVFERNLGGAFEQRVILPNTTAVSGDNVIHIRAQTAASSELERFNFSEVAARFGGMPTPFERVNEGSLTSGRDDLGNFVYARESVGTSTVCVLVLRRMGLGARPMPRGTQALDVVMRNCVNGTVEEALAPMRGRALAVSGVAGATNTLSPYAAPGG